MEPIQPYPERRRTPGDGAWPREFARLYRKWYRPVVSLCRQYGPAVDAEAAAQEAFTRAWLAWDRFSPDRPFGPWIATISRRVCLDQLSRSDRQAETLPRAAALFGPPVVHSAEGIAAAMDTATAVDTILQALPTRQRQVLELREIEGWSYEHIAQVMGTSVEGVRGVLRRARRSFKAAFEQLGSSGGFGAAVVRLRDTFQRWAWPRGGSANSVSRWVPAELLGVLVPLALASGTTVPAAAPAPTTTTVVAAATTSPPAVTAPDSARGQGKARPVAPAARQPVSRQAEAKQAASGIRDSITFIAVSPSYQDDQTVYASGVSDCGLPRGCPVLYRSTDGGGTWARLPAVGRARGNVMVPPAYPKDRRIFSAGENELQVSDDDGATFRTVGLARSAAAMSPQFSNGDPRIFFGRSWTDVFVGVGFEYHDGVGVKPLSLSIPPGSAPEHFAFSESYATDGVIVIGGTSMLPGRTVPYSVVFECVHDECRMHDLDVAVGSPRIVGRSAAHREALAATPFALFRSPSDGAPFQPIDYPGSHDHRQVVEDVIRLADGRLLLSVQVDQVNRRGRLYSSDDNGDTWTALAEEDGVAFHSLVQLPDGRLLGAGVPGEGLYCSMDVGRTWAPTCS